MRLPPEIHLPHLRLNTQDSTGRSRIPVFDVAWYKSEAKSVNGPWLHIALRVMGNGVGSTSAWVYRSMAEFIGFMEEA